MMEHTETTSRNVMLVEDFDDTRQMVKRLLELGGYNVIEAANGQQAIELAQAVRPDLILMDLNMPVLDGFTATLRIREHEPTREVPIVAITAYDTREFRSAASAVGCNEYLAKPLDFEQLMQTLGRLLPGGEMPVGTPGGGTAAAGAV